MTEPLDSTLARLKSRIESMMNSNKQFSELQTRYSLIDPFLEALGWDLEDYLQTTIEAKMDDDSGKVDYSFKIDGELVLMLEAKKFNSNLTEFNNRGQINKYFHGKSIQWLILTDGNKYLLIDGYTKAGSKYRATELFEIIDYNSDNNIIFEYDVFKKKNRIKDYLFYCKYKTLLNDLLKQYLKENTSMDPYDFIFDKCCEIGIIERDRTDRSNFKEKARKILTSVWENETEEPEPKEIVQPAEKPTLKELEKIELDTIVVPAQDDGFKEVFLGENRWYAIRLDSIKINKIKHIAAYQVYPVSAITHIATIKDIKPWKNTGKYVLTFVEPAKEIEPITLVLKRDGGKVKAPQAPRYASMARIKKAKTLDDLW